MKDSHSLHEKYPDLPSSQEVQRTLRRHGGAEDPARHAPRTKEEKVDAYLQFLETHFSTKPGKSPLENAAFQRLREKILKDYTIRIADPKALSSIAEGLYAFEKKVAIARGYDMPFTDRAVEENPDIILNHYKFLIQEKYETQQQTLSTWLEYLQQNDAGYPMWFRYLVVRSLKKMGLFDKERRDYSHRTKETVAAFPECNAEALGWVYRQMSQFNEDDRVINFPPAYLAPNEDQQKHKEKILRAVQAKDFAKLYAFAQVETAGNLNKESLKGKWKTYAQGSDPLVLEQEIRGKGTGWCTAEGLASSHLASGDFHIYFTENEEEKFTEPRIAVRMEGGKVAEVRGVEARQALEPALVEEARKFYNTLPGGKKFEKKADDMRRMSELVEKNTRKEEFTKEDLEFLYEVHAPIEGFGYGKDPRIAALCKARQEQRIREWDRDRVCTPITNIQEKIMYGVDLDREDLALLWEVNGSKLYGSLGRDTRIGECRWGRNDEEDMQVIFDCTQRQMAYTSEDIAADTRVYCGRMEAGIFQKFPPDLQYIFYSFPNRKIWRRDFFLGGMDFPDLMTAVNNRGVIILEEAEGMLARPELQEAITERFHGPRKISEQGSFICIAVQDLGFSGTASMKDIVQKAKSIGLDLCLPEDALYYCLQKESRGIKERLYFGMEPVLVIDGEPGIFTFSSCPGEISELDGSTVDGSKAYHESIEFIFRLPRKV